MILQQVEGAVKSERLHFERICIKKNSSRQKWASLTPVLLPRAGGRQRSSLVQRYHTGLVWWDDPQQGGPCRGDTLTAGEAMGREGMGLRETTERLLKRYLHFPSDNFAH